MSAFQSECVGVDGARSGWIAVWEQQGELAFGIYANPAEVCLAHAKAKVIAVDIPIGLSDHGPRAPDAAARRAVGGKRASSVFSAPVRGILDAMSQSEASRRHREIDGRGFGAQAFGILPKIRAWDTLLAADATLRKRVFEIHPEVCFAALNGGTGLVEPKKSEEGALKRIAILGDEFGGNRVRRLLASCPRKMADTDDVLDALVALWSANRIAAGVAVSLPSKPLVDSVGLVTAIHY